MSSLTAKKISQPFSLPNYWWSVILATLILAMGCDGCQEADISVTSMEITQGIQTAANSVPLVANRGTAVRVTVNTNGAVDVEGIRGLLTVTVGGTEITPAGGLIPINTLTGVTSPNRNTETHTLNFELPAPSGITASSNVDFTVDVVYINDPNTANNSFSVNNLTFEERHTPDLIFSRMDYIPAGTGAVALATVAPGQGDAMVRGIFPVDDSDPGLYSQALFPILGFSSDFNGNNLIDKGNESSALLDELEAVRSLLVFLGIRPLNTTFMYGWLNGSPMNSFGGAGRVGAFVAYGNTTLTQYQRSYAHELGHNFGLNHNNRTITPDAGWDVGARLENNPAANNVTGRVKPSTFVDIMNSGPATNATWVDQTTYSFFESSPILARVEPAVSAAGKVVYAGIKTEVPDEVPSVLNIRGVFNQEGSELVSLLPTLRLEGPARVPAFAENGPFTALVTNEQGNRQSFSFDAKVCYEGQEALSYGGFSIFVPMPTAMKVKTVEIIDNATGRRMGGWQASEPSKVQLISPDQGSVLGERTTVRWRVSDPDTDLKDLVFYLTYSPDEGRTWVPVGVNLKGDSYTFNSTQIQKATKGLLKIYACDGLNTATHQIANLSTSAARF